jgi:hypothetical protein
MKTTDEGRTRKGTDAKVVVWLYASTFLFAGGGWISLLVALDASMVDEGDIEAGLVDHWNKLADEVVERW